MNRVIGQNRFMTKALILLIFLQTTIQASIGVTQCLASEETLELIGQYHPIENEQNLKMKLEFSDEEVQHYSIRLLDENIKASLTINDEHALLRIDDDYLEIECLN